MRCEPANTLIIKLGGLTQVARAVQTTPNGVMRWRMPKAKGGTGGAVPHWHIATLISFAADHDLDLELADFFPAPNADEVASASRDLPDPTHVCPSSKLSDNAADASSCPVPVAAQAAQGGV